MEQKETRELSSDAQINPQNSSELVKHTRKIHFALILACLVILVTNTIESPYEISKAYKDIKFIREIQDNWDTELIQNVVPKVVNKYMEENPNIKQLQSRTPKYTVFEIDEKPVSIEFHLDNSTWTLRQNTETNMEIGGSDPRIPTYSLEYSIEELIEKGYTKRQSYSTYEDGKYIDIDQEIILRKPDTLKDFIDFWDDFSPPLFVYVPQNVWVYARLDILNLASKPSKHTAQIEDLKDETTTDKYIKRTLYLMPKDQGFSLKDVMNKISFESEGDKVLFEKWAASEKNFTHQFFAHKERFGKGDDDGCPILAHYYFRIPVFTSKIPFNLHRELMNKFNYSIPWRTGKFRDIFSELYEAAEDINYLKIEDIEKIIHKQMKKAGGNFEILGVKFPRSALSIYGLIIIISIQVYFMLHFKTFYLRTDVHDTSWSYPWIALYTDIWSRVLFLISILILPIFTVYILSKTSYSVLVNNHKDLVNYLNVLPSTISISSSIISVYLWHKFTKKRKSL